MRLLYYGNLAWGTTALQRLDALRELVSYVYAVDTRMFVGEYTTRSVWSQIQLRLGWGPLARRLSTQLVMEANRYRPDVVWVDQGNCVTSKAIATVRKQIGAFCVHYTPDSLKSPGFNSRYFRQVLPEYNLCITTKPHELRLYKSLGAKDALFVSKGFDPKIHRPVALSATAMQKYKCDVAFIGQRMSARAASLSALVEQVPCNLKIYGRQWDKGSTARRLGLLQQGWVYGDEYAKAICGATICLAFLNHEAGDTFTQRTIEIPACGGFMLAERTEMHQSLFEENQEAVFFSDNDEMIDKIKYYLANDEARERIRIAGYSRALKSNYTCQDRMRECIAACEKHLEL